MQIASRAMAGHAFDSCMHNKYSPFEVGFIFFVFLFFQEVKEGWLNQAVLIVAPSVVWLYNDEPLSGENVNWLQRQVQEAF